jgi:hypothetical protein
MKYTFKGLWQGSENIPKNYMHITIRAHSEREAYIKAGKQTVRWHLDLIPNEQGSLIWEQIEVKSRKPKNKHPAKPPELNGHELNELVKQIETIYRTTKSGWNNSRLGSIPASEVRKIIWKHKIGFVCKYCLADFRGRYCCPAHSEYYRAVNMKFYGRQYPWGETHGSSVDHIKPISMGGLEFDRDNLQWMDLAENIRKGGANRIRAQQRAQLKAQLQTAFLQAQALYQATGFGQHPIKRYLEEVVK